MTREWGLCLPVYYCVPGAEVGDRLIADSQYISAWLLLGVLCRQHWASSRNLEPSWLTCTSVRLCLRWSRAKAGSFHEVSRKEILGTPQFCIHSPFPLVHSSFLDYIAFQNIRFPHLYFFCELFYCLIIIVQLKSEKQSWVNYTALLSCDFLIAQVRIWKCLLHGIFEETEWDKLPSSRWLACSKETEATTIQILSRSTCLRQLPIALVPSVLLYFHGLVRALLMRLVTGIKAHTVCFCVRSPSQHQGLSAARISRSRHADTWLLRVFQSDAQNSELAGIS